MTIELPINSTTDMRLDRSMLQRGVEVSVNGSVVGHLVQKTHGLRRKDRTMQLIGINPDRYPAGLIFGFADRAASAWRPAVNGSLVFGR